MGLYMKRIIVDFDNTMGVEGRDVDDGLAFLYLLAQQDVHIEAVCTSYGNSDIDTVTQNTQRVFRELGLDIPLYRGAASPRNPQSAASQYLAQAAAECLGELHLVVTGSTTNIRGALAHDERFLDNVGSISLMGGVTETLAINGRIMDELNLSCDPDATMLALAAPCPVTVATAQNCLPAFFTREDLANNFGEDSWLLDKCGYWFADMERAYHWHGWTCWDVVAAAALVHPELFHWDEMDVTLYRRFLAAGYLERAAGDVPEARISVPRIRDAEEFKAHVIASWKEALSACVDFLR